MWKIFVDHKSSIFGFQPYLAGGIPLWAYHQFKHTHHSFQGFYREWYRPKVPVPPSHYSGILCNWSTIVQATKSSNQVVDHQFDIRYRIMFWFLFGKCSLENMEVVVNFLHRRKECRQAVVPMPLALWGTQSRPLQSPWPKCITWERYRLNFTEDVQFTCHWKVFVTC